ncbi:MAG: hypothetical protein Q7R54_00370 [bacterium]|nr:hypothetical protein [bacterium]
MIKDYEKFILHLKKTGRMKLLPHVLRELRIQEARQKMLTSKKETAKENPSLISGYRTLENGMLTDRSAKSALISIYQRITG